MAKKSTTLKLFPEGVLMRNQIAELFHARRIEPTSEMQKTAPFSEYYLPRLVELSHDGTDFCSFDEAMQDGG